MRIDLNGVNINGLPQHGKAKRVSVKEASVGGDQLQDKASLSQDAVSVPDLEAVALATRAVRQDRVAELTQAVRNGQYKLDAGEIAKAMLQQHQR